MPAHRRGCLLGCKLTLPPYGGHGPTIAVCIEYTYWEDQHEAGHQRWLLCLPRAGHTQDTADASQAECVSPIAIVWHSYVVHVSLPCSNVLVIQAFVNCHIFLHRQLGLVHTRTARRARVEAALPILLSILSCHRTFVFFRLMSEVHQ